MNLCLQPMNNSITADKQVYLVYVEHGDGLADIKPKKEETASSIFIFYTISDP